MKKYYQLIREDSILIIEFTDFRKYNDFIKKLDSIEKGSDKFYFFKDFLKKCCKKSFDYYICKE